MDASLVKVRRDGAVLRVELAVGPTGFIDPETSRSFTIAFRTFREDPTLRVAILSIDGEDLLSGARDGETKFRESALGEFDGLKELRSLNKPVIACVQGAAIDTRMELALACDLIYVSETASFAFSSAERGDICAEAVVKLPRRIPYHVAMELLYTGRVMDAQEARRWGLVNAVLPHNELVPEVDEIALKIAGGPPLVFAAIKEVARTAEGEAFQTSMNRVTRRQLPTVDALYGSEDILEGFKAFAEKRAPIWSGR